MENGANRCSTCKFLDRFYVRGIKKYTAVEYGWCCKKAGICKTKDICAEYMRKPIKRKPKYALQLVLCNLLTDISTIRNILENELDENE